MALASLQPGTLLNQRFKILEIVGQGGMGTVYKAEHVRLHAVYAIKEIRGTSAEGAEKQQDLAACEHEAQFLVKLDHPNLPKVTDAFIENDNFYLVMQFIEGVTLDSRLAAVNGAPLDVLQSVEWGLQIADVLTYLHSQEPPIIFRDMKPSNVMVQPDGTIKLIDFGIARHFQPGASKDTSLLGSVGYSPPEQFGRGQTDARSDVYAFGATLHHLVTGRDPAVQPFKFPPAETLNRQVPNSLSHLLETCLSMEPNQRPQSINVVAMQLLRVREELVQRRAQAEAQQAALNAIGRSLAEKMEPATTGLSPRVNTRSSSGNMQEGEERNGERGKEAQETRKPSIKVTTASTAKSISSNEAQTVVLPVLLLLLLVIGAGVAVTAYSTRHQAHKVASLPTITAPSVHINQDTEAQTPEPTPTPTPQDGQSESSSNVGAHLAPNTPLMPPPNDKVTLQTALLSLNGDMLPIAISGMVKDHAGESMQLGVYFFDAKGLPINATDPNPAYINQQRYLCVYKTLAIASNEYSVQETLSLPIRLLTGVTQPEPFTYQAILFLNGKPMGETARVALPQAAYVDGSGQTTPPSNNGTSSRAGGVSLGIGK